MTRLTKGRCTCTAVTAGTDNSRWLATAARSGLADDHVANLERLTTGPRTGEILALPVEAPGAGRP